MNLNGQNCPKTVPWLQHVYILYDVWRIWVCKSQYQKENIQLDMKLVKKTLDVSICKITICHGCCCSKSGISLWVGGCILCLDRPGAMRTDCVICLWFWSLPDSLEIEWLYTYIHFVGGCLTIRTSLIPYGLTRCYMHRLRHLSPCFWASPMQHKMLLLLLIVAIIFHENYVNNIQMACLIASPGH